MKTYTVKLVSSDYKNIHLGDNPEKFCSYYRVEAESKSAAVFDLLRSFSFPVPIVWEVVE